MRLDKYLKVSRIIKRRTVAKEACDGGRVSIGGRIAKPGTEQPGKTRLPKCTGSCPRTKAWPRNAANSAAR